MRRFLSIVGVLAPVLTLTACASTRTAGCMCPERREILAVVQTFFNTLENRDAESARHVMMPEGVVVSTRTIDGEQVVRARSNTDFIATLGDDPRHFFETMQDPMVLVDGDIAVVWTDYRFEIDGELSHTGVDAFTLLRENGVWRIAGGVYNVKWPGEE